ncbi:MAG: saccharopine dehydrogenase, partial [Pseudomonadales bacterium]|nr:saccharopine dehydrogenase [Pseudomonadales bacterium]
RNVHRTNLLLDHRYGTDFRYDEMMMTGPGEAGRALAEQLARTDMMAAGDDAPKPGEGPSKEERENGSYALRFVGEADDGARMAVRVTGDRDPGYGSTSRMIAECALCLVDEAADLPGGVWTPAAAFGHALVERLRAHAGMTFEVLD